MGPLTKRVVWLAGGLAVILFLLFDRRVAIPVGVLAGAVLSLYKIRLYRRVLTSTVNQSKSSGVTTGIGILYILLPFLFLWVTVMVDHWLFMGAAVGLLVCVMIILVNITTEKIGLTHNDWVDWF